LITLAKRTLVILLALLMVFTPRMVQWALAQDDQDGASADEVQVVQQLAKAGYLTDKKDFYLSAKNLSEDDVTDALVAINTSLANVDLKTLKPGDPRYKAEDLQSLLKLAQDYSDDIRDRKVSVWKFESRIKKMIAALNGTPATVSGTPAAAPAVETPTPVVVPSPTPTPIPGPTRQEWEDLKGTLKDLDKKTSDMRDAYDKKMDALQKSGDEVKGISADEQEQLKLVKKLLDTVQEDLKKTGDKLDQVAQKANEKNITDTELQEELTVMHKDLRDNVEDVSVLKQEVAKLDKSNEAAGESPLDQALNSKYLAGGALVVGLAALIVALTKK